MRVMCSESLGTLASKERGLVNCLYSVVAPLLPCLSCSYPINWSSLTGLIEFAFSLIFLPHLHHPQH